MLRLIKMEIDQAPLLHFQFTVEIPSHAVHERNRSGVTANLGQLGQELAVAKGDGMHTVQRLPIARIVIDATPLLHLHGAGIVIKRPRVADVIFDAHRLPAADLVIQLGVRTAQPTWVTDHAQFVDRWRKVFRFRCLCQLYGHENEPRGDVSVNSYAEIPIVPEATRVESCYYD